MPPVLSKPADAAVAVVVTEHKLRQKFEDWFRACDHVEASDVGEGLLTQEDIELMHNLRTSKAEWRKRVAELLPIFVAHSRKLEPKSRKMWATAKKHVADTSKHLNLLMWKATSKGKMGWLGDEFRQKTETRRVDDEIASSSAKHAPKTQKVDVSKGHLDTDVMGHIYEGFDLRKIQSSCGAFPPIEKSKSDEFDDSPYIPDRADRPRSALNKPAPMWMEKHLISHAIGSYEKKAKSGDVTEITQADAEQLQDRGGLINFAHTIDQSSPEKPKKFRDVIYYKTANEEAGSMPEHIRLPSHATATAAAAFMQTGKNYSAFAQSKKDISTVLHNAELKSKAFLGRKTERAEEAIVREKTSCVIDDYSGAYEQLACSDKDDNCIGVWDTARNKWRFFLSPLMNFGARSSVQAWGRVAAPVIYVMRHVFKIPYFLYVDDAFAFVPSDLAEEIRAIYKTVASCFGLRLSEPKSYCGQEPDLLGCAYDLTDDEAVSVHLIPHKKEKLKARIKNYVDATRSGASGITQYELSQLLGSLNFLIVSTRYSVLRAIIYPLYKHVGDADKKKKVPSKEIHGTLLNCQELVLAYNGLRFCTKNNPQEVCYLYTDASEGESVCPYFGAVLIDNAGRKIRTLSQAVTSEQHGKLLQFRTKAIAPLETYALLCALQTWKHELRNKKVVLLNDNQSVVFGLLKGASADIFVRTGVQRIYNTLAEYGILASIRWVPSAHNVSDGLTREDLMPTCNAVLEKFARQSGFDLAHSMADNGSWTDCLSASHNACANNGTKRPEAKKNKRPRGMHGQPPKPKKHKKSDSAHDNWGWSGYDHSNDWDWSGYDRSSHWY
jgi:hypothetical protein